MPYFKIANPAWHQTKNFPYSKCNEQSNYGTFGLSHTNYYLYYYLYKTCMQETLNLLMHADSTYDTKKDQNFKHKKKKKN